MPNAATSNPAAIVLEPAQKRWLLWVGVFAVYGWVIMCLQPRDAVSQFGYGAAYGLVTALMMNAYLQLVRGNSADTASRGADPWWPYLFATVTAALLFAGGLLGLGAGQLGNQLGWNGWKVYMLTTWPLGAVGIGLYWCALHVRGRSCLRAARRRLSDEDYEGVVRAASIGLQYDLGQPLSRRFAAELRFLRGGLLLGRQHYAAAEDFRRLSRDDVAPETTAGLMREACVRLAAQLRLEDAKSGRPETAPLSPDNIQKWFDEKTAAERRLDAAIHDEFDQNIWLFVLLFACLAYFFFLK